MIHLILLDPEDQHLLSKYGWSLDGGYAKAWPDATTRVTLQELVLNTKEEVDHRNGNKLDCRKQNLRICTHQQNCYNRSKPSHNTSGYKGVEKSGKNWKANITFGGLRKYLGTFLTALEAAKAYNAAAIKYHGEFARLNEV